VTKSKLRNKWAQKIKLILLDELKGVGVSGDWIGCHIIAPGGVQLLEDSRLPVNGTRVGLFTYLFPGGCSFGRKRS